MITKSFSRFDALAQGIYPLSDEKLPEVFQSDRLSCEVDVNVREYSIVTKFILLFLVDFERITKGSW